jgi:hypothetical protein
MAAAVAAMAARAQRHIRSHFLEAGATEPGKAVPFMPRRNMERRFFRRLIEFGALNEAAPGTYWLDTVKLAEFRRRRRKRVLTAVSAVLAVGAAAAALFS